MKRRWLLKTGSAITVACTAVAMGVVPASAGGDRGNVDGTLVIGSLAPETGDLSSIAQSLRVPVEIAVAEMNEAGGVNDTPVTLVTGDDGTDPQVASATIDRMLTSDLADVLTGPASSPTTTGILDKIETNQIPICSGSNTSPAFTPKGTGGGFYFRTAPPDKLQAPATAELILGAGHANVAIIALNDDYGQGYAKALSKALKQGGAKVVANVPYDPEGTVFDSDAQEVADADPDAIAVIAFPETGSKVLQALIAAGVGPADKAVFTTDGLDDSSIPELVDPANLGGLDGVQGTTPAAAPAGVEHPFHEVFAATGVDTVFSSYYYDCAIIFALASQSAGTDDAVQIRKHVKKVLKGDTECNTFADCKEALEAGDTINYNGAASDYAKFSDHEPLVGVYDVYTFDAAGEKSTLGDDAQITIP